MTPREASADPSKMGSIAEPIVNPPPWIHTITGSGAAAAPVLLLGTNTFRYRQSSEVVAGQVALGIMQVWTHPGLSSEGSGIVQASGGEGGANRSGPTGGAAYGTPKNELGEEEVRVQFCFEVNF